MANPEPLQTPIDRATQCREKAIDLYLGGEAISSLLQQVGRKRSWFYLTLKRYQSGGRSALASQSRRPKRSPRRTAPEVEAAIERTRKAITSGNDPILRYGNIGAEAIAAELQHTTVQPPSRATINRILRRRGLVQPRSRKKRKMKLPEDYPWPAVQQPNELHLFDFVLRTLVGGTRFYSCNLLDQTRRWPFLRVITTKNALAVSQFLVSAWQEIGLPYALYLDNDVVWRGSSHGQRTISRIVRLSLLLGIEVIFIPSYTPEANPLIESFNSVWDRNFWQRNQFFGVEQVGAELPYFQQYCRTHRPLAEFGHLTPDQRFAAFRPLCLSGDFVQHRAPLLPLTSGKIHFIRFVTTEGTFNVLNEIWKIDPELWAGKTIRATIETAKQQMRVYHQSDAQTACQEIACFAYELREKAAPLLPEFERSPRPIFWPITLQTGDFCPRCVEPIFLCKSTEKVSTMS